MGAKAYLLGFDAGSSSVKAALLEVETGRVAASAIYPRWEMGMASQGWAEQDPELW